MGKQAALWGVGLLCVVGMAAGCATSRSNSASGVSAAGAVTPSLPLIGQPTPISLDSLSLPSRQTVEQARTKKPEATGYRLLLEPQCQCLGAAQSTLGNLLDNQRDAVLAGAAGHCRRNARGRGSLTADLLALRAVEERNHSAATALTLYYQLNAAPFQSRSARSLVDPKPSARSRIFKRRRPPAFRSPATRRNSATRKSTWPTARSISTVCWRSWTGN